MSLGMADFPKEKRILKRQEFRRTLDSGSKVVGRDLVVLATLREGGGTRLGIIVSKKVGNAVVRNRVKRLWREIFRQSRWAACSSGYDVVLISRVGAVGRSYTSLEESFDRAMRGIEKKLGGLRPGFNQCSVGNIGD